MPDELDEGLRDRARRVRGEDVLLGNVERLDAADRHRLADRECLQRLTERARERERLLREVTRLLDIDEDHLGHPDPTQHLDDGGRRVRPAAEDLRLLGGALGEGEPDLLEP